MSTLTSLFFVLSALLVFYNTYLHLWFHIIKIFESNNRFSSKYANIANDDNDLNSNSFMKLISSDELSISNQKIIDFLKKFSRIAFSTSITTSFLVIEFILYQFMRSEENEDQDHHATLTFWNVNLVVIAINLVVIHPILITVLLVNKFFKSRLLNNLSIKSITTLIIFIFWCLTLSKFDSFTDLDVLDNQDSNIISYCLLRVSIIGITLIAALNGIGSFSTAYYRLFKKSSAHAESHYTPEHLLSLERTLENTDNMIKRKEVEFEKQQSLRPYADESQINKRPNLQPKGSFLDLNTLNQTLNPFKSKSSSSKLENELISEINSLKIIKNDIYLKMLKIEKTIDQNSKRDTNQFLRKIIPMSLSIYCTFKILQVTSIKLISLFNSQFYHEVTTKESDPLVLTIVKTIQIVLTIQDEEFLINQLSFIVSGALFLCSINGVFMTFQHLYKFLPLDLSKLNKTTTQNTKYQSVSIIKNLLISELTGIYTLATILILKSNLTSNFSSKLNVLFQLTNQNLSMYQLDSWFDKIFLISVIITATSIKVGEYLSDDIEGFENQTLNDKIV